MFHDTVRELLKKRLEFTDRGETLRYYVKRWDSYLERRRGATSAIE